jgi:WD40 repeat protein
MRTIYFPVWIAIALVFAVVNVNTATLEDTPQPTATALSPFETLQDSPNARFGHVEMSPDFKQFRVASCKKLFLYDANTYQVIRELPYAADSGCFDRVAFGSNTSLAVATTPGKIEIWNTDFTQKTATFEGIERYYVLALYYDIAKNLLLVGQQNGIRIWYTEHFTESPPLIAIPDGYAGAYAAGIRIDGSVFAIDLPKNTPDAPEYSVGMWNIKTRQMLARLDTGDETPRTLTFSPDGQLLAVGTLTGLVQLWDVETEELIAGYNAATDDRITANGADIVISMAFSPDGNYLAAATVTNVTVWRLTDGAQTDLLSNNSEYQPGLAFNPNSDVIILGGDDTLQLWHFNR